jgi:hypothetical protein
MDLAQIWLRRIFGNAGTVLHRHAEMGIAFDA